MLVIPPSSSWRAAERTSRKKRARPVAGGEADLADCLEALLRSTPLLGMGVSHSPVGAAGAGWNSSPAGEKPVARCAEGEADDTACEMDTAQAPQQQPEPKAG
jgi:hypothetical protein